MSNRAAVYRRVSTTRQSGDDRYSLPDQLERCTEHARSLGIEVVRDFCEVHSGAELDERPQMSALREAVRNHEIDVIISTKLDRLARDQIHQSVLVYEFEKHNVRVSLVDEVFEDTPSGRFMRSARGFLSEMERELIKSRTTAGRSRRVREGKMIPTWIPLYGYLWTDERKTGYAINPETAPVVQRIYGDIASGKPIRKIARELTAEGIATPKDYWRRYQANPNHPPQGRAWNPATIWGILTNPTYCGQHTAFTWELTSRTEQDLLTGKSVIVHEKRQREIGEQRVLLPDAAPALVSQDVLEAVKHRLEFNKATSARNNKHPEVALLRGGLATCGLCGSTMIVDWYTSSTGQSIPIYRCVRSMPIGGKRVCSGASITVSKMDALVWGKARDVLQDPDILMREAEKRFSDNGKEDTIEGYRKQLKLLDQKRASLAEAIGEITTRQGQYGMDVLVAQLEKASKDKEVTQKKLTKLEEDVRDWQAVQQRLHTIEAWCHSAARSLDTYTYDEKRIVLFGLTTRVQVWPKDHKPRYRIRMGHDEDILVEGEHAPEAEEIGADCVQNGLIFRLPRSSEA